MITSMILACGYNGEIGANNDLIWQLPRDIKHFASITRGNNVFMGRRTYESLPFKMATLPGRSNFVITSNPKHVHDNYSRRLSHIIQKNGVENLDPFSVFPSLEEALVSARDKRENKDYHESENIIIGGGALYDYALENGLIEKVYRTVVHKSFPEADVLIKNTDLSSLGFIIDSVKHFAPDDKNSIGMSFETWNQASVSSDL